MRVLFVSSEIYPLAKTGGLADVSGALPKALSNLGVDMRLLLPGYPGALAAAAGKTVVYEIDDFMGAGPMKLVAARTPDTGLPLWLLDCPALYRRPGTPYQDEYGRDWPDNALRFAVLNHAAARLSRGELVGGWRADIVHANDWHVGLLPAILADAPDRRPATVFTVHNLAYQGVFSTDHFQRLGLGESHLSPDGIEFWGNISFIKAGIRYSDHVTTVSPTYAEEIMTPEFGCGLDEVLRSRAGDLAGILNGADYLVWDPSTDVHLPANFTARQVGGKRVCKTALQDELGLESDPEKPLVLFMSRITGQKMADVVADSLPAIVEAGAQCVLFGDGERGLEERFAEQARRYPGRIVYRGGYREPLAHRLLAGSDILLHPSRFEPCGLTQIYAMRYGTLPVVRNTGGLRDTVVGATEQTVRSGEATGFAFDGTDAGAMLAAVAQALALYRQPLLWRKLQRQAMAQDFTWAESARRYLAIYNRLAPQGPTDDAEAARVAALEPILEKAAG